MRALSRLSASPREASLPSAWPEIPRLPSAAPPWPHLSSALEPQGPAREQQGLGFVRQEPHGGGARPAAEGGFHHEPVLDDVRELVAVRDETSDLVQLRLQVRNPKAGRLLAWLKAGGSGARDVSSGVYQPAVWPGSTFCPERVAPGLTRAPLPRTQSVTFAPLPTTASGARIVARTTASDSMRAPS